MSTNIRSKFRDRKRLFKKKREKEEKLLLEEEENKLKENPDYDYSDEHRPAPVPHKCPVCGEYEFPNILSSDICPVCGWEDIGYEEIPDEKPNDYMMSFNEKVAWFKEKRKKDPKFRWIDQNDPD